MTLAQYLDVLADNSPDKKIHTAQLAEILIEIAKILDYFKNSYGFYHNDLHTNNIMIKNLANGEYIITFIDFGGSCIEISNVKYKPHKGCRPYELVILLGDLYTYGGARKGPNIFTENCKKQLRISTTDIKIMNKFIDYKNFIYFWSRTLQNVKGGSTRRKRRRSRVRSTSVRPTRVRSTHHRG